MTLRCISWIAVSSQPQTERESPLEQRNANAAIVTALGGELVATLEVPGQSRDIIGFERACELITAYAQLRDLIDHRGADLLVCRDLSRLGRTQALIAQVVAYCQAAGIALYPRNAPPTTLDAQAQSDSDSNVLLTAINASFAEIEINTLRRRWQYGMQGRLARGDFLTKPVYGYRVVRDRRGKTIGYATAPDEAGVVRKALLDLYLTRGLSQAAIAGALNAAGFPPPRNAIWTAGTINSLLRRVERYAGHLEARLASGTIITRGRWPAILTAAETAAIRAEQLRRTGGRRSWRNYLFSLCVVCGTCGRFVAANGADVDYPDNRYYRCRFCRQTFNERVFVEELTRAVRFAQDRGNHAAILAQTPDQTQHVAVELAAAGEQRAAIERQRKKLTRAYSLEQIDEGEYRALMAETVTRRNLLDARLRALEQSQATAQNQAKRAERLGKIVTYGNQILETMRGETLSQEEIKRINAWIRRFFRFTVAHGRITHVEFL